MRELVFLLCLIVVSATKRVSYHDYKVYQISPSNEKQLNLLRTFEDNSYIKFWSDVTRFKRPVDVMVAPSYQSNFKNILEKHQINFKLLINNVETTLIKERLAQTTSHREISFDKYYRYSEIQDYLRRLQYRYRNLVSLENYGLSFEKRNLTLIHISSARNENKPTIFIGAGTHAMEWIGPAQALFIIHQLLDRPKNRKLIKHVDWVIVPLINPDGYEYSHTTDRFWRGTRSKGKLCDGVDPNRNYDFHWGEVGSSNDECSYFFAGPSPFSEIETVTYSQAILKYANQTKLYLDIHSPVQAFLHPWSYTTELPENAADLNYVATKAADAIFAVNGTKYDVGSSTNVFQPSSGSSRDWAYAVAGIKLSYTLELPQGGITGFDMPPERILDVVEETFEGIKAFHRYIEEAFSKL